MRERDREDKETIERIARDCAALGDATTLFNLGQYFNVSALAVLDRLDNKIQFAINEEEEAERALRAAFGVKEAEDDHVKQYAADVMERVSERESES